MTGMPQGWAPSKLGEVADVRLGKMLDKEKNKGEPVPYLRNVNVRWGSLDLADLLLMRMTTEEQDTYSIQDGDVLICEGGEPGRAAVWRSGPTELKFQKAIHRARSRGAVVPELIAYYMRRVAASGELGSRFTGTTIKHLPLETIREFPFPLPPLPEQRRIVARIDSVSAKSSRARANLDHIPRLVEKYKQAILAAAFRGELTRERREKGPAAAAPWRNVTLGEVAEIQSGITLGKKRAPSTQLIRRPYLRVANVQRGWLDLGEIKEIDVTEQEAARLYLRDGDILMNEGGDRDKLGRGWIWGGQIENCIHQNHVFRVRLLDQAFPSKFVSLYANEFGQSHFFDVGKQTTNLASISKTKLSTLQLRLPPAEEAVEVVRRIETAFTWIDRLAAEATSARKLIAHLDQAILAKAFRGELVPQDPTDEPATALLERIRAERRGAIARPQRAGRRS